jgi:putative ABC transport system permease protein
VVGVALALALLFATVQFLDASRTMLDTYFFRAQRQDMTVTFTEAKNRAVIHELAQIEGVLRVEALRAVPVELSLGNRRERTSIEAGEDDAQLAVRIDGDQNETKVPSAGLMLSRQLANQLQARAGDRILVRMLGGRRTVTFMPVTRIIEEYVGARAYASQATLQALARDATPAGSALLRIDPAARAAILTELKDMPAVLGVSERDAALDKFEEMIGENMNTMLAFYIAFASAIAVGVVYNSARILFSERAHELATLRVLGYHRSEVGVVLLGEVALLVVLAVPVGCILGYWLAQIMTAMFSSDLFRLPFAPSRASYGWATVVVLAAALLTAAAVARRVLKLDMVRVLKARD